MIKKFAVISKGLGMPMKGIEVSVLAEGEKLQVKRCRTNLLPYPFTQLKPWMEADNALNRNFVLIDYFYRKKKIMYSIRE